MSDQTGDSLLTQGRIDALKKVKKLTTDRLKFYLQSHQFWFKNLDTQSEHPIPIALLDEVVHSEAGSEAYRISMQKLKQYVEERHGKDSHGKG